MSKYWVKIICYFSIIRRLSFAARILSLHPLFSKSHSVFNDAIANSLLAAGHQVTAATSFPNTLAHPNYTVIDTTYPFSSNVTNFVSMNVGLEMSASFAIVDTLVNYTEKKCYHTINLPEIRKIVESNEKLFDLLMFDMAGYTFECFLPIAERFDTPIIATLPTRTWLNAEWNAGNPYNPAVVPHEISYHSVQMTFWKRLKNGFDFLLDALHRYCVLHPRLREFYRLHFPRSTVARRKTPSILFLNGHSIFTPRPMQPSVVNIGGIHVMKEKPLPESLKTFIDEAEHGVILFSIGSLLQSHTLSTNMLAIFRKVFAQIPQRVIWKAEEQIDRLSANILLSKWLPQRDVLAHKNVVAFISHCGASGMYEALYSGTPMILTPVFFDQMSNAMILEQLEVAIYLDLFSLTEGKLRRALNDVINGTKYRRNVSKISSLIRDEPISPQKMVVYWTEYVLRNNGTKALNSEAARMPLYQYLLLDVIGSVLITSFGIYFGMYYVCSIIRRNRKIFSDLIRNSSSS